MNLLEKIKSRPELTPTLWLLGDFLLLCIISSFPILDETMLGGVSLMLSITSVLMIATLAVILWKTKRQYGKGASRACFFLSPVLCFFLVDGLNGVTIFLYNPITGLINYLLYLMLHLLLYAIFSRMRTAVILCNIFAFVFGVINHFVMAFRGSPVLPWDVASAGTAMTVLPNFQIELKLNLIFCTVLFILMLLVAWRVRYVSPDFNKNKRTILLNRSVILVLLAGYTYLLVFSGIPALFGVKDWAWRQNIAAQQNGAFTNFMLNLKYVIVQKPDGYSASAAKKIADSVTQPETLTDTTPDNIIVIMNESFADLGELGDFQTNVDYLPFLHSLQKEDNTRSGNLLVSIHGSGTCNSEFEVLTGNSTAFLPAGSIAYQQYIKKPLTSLASLFKQDDFSTTALHPFYSTGWSRNTVYPLIGFDQFLSMEDWLYPDKVRDYISDEANYDKIIEQYENKSEGQKSFYFNVTMQNHGGYTDEMYPATVKLEGMQGYYPKVEQYLTLIKKSDTALEHFVDYFREQDEKTIILFFGDHQPSVENEFYEELYGKKLEDLSLEELQKRYETPYFIWANYDLPDVDYGDISANYLSAAFLQTAGFELPDYQKFLLNLREQIPELNANGYLGDDGNWYTFDQKSDYTDLIEQYEILQYNNMFDRKNRLTSVFE